MRSTASSISIINFITAVFVIIFIKLIGYVVLNCCDKVVHCAVDIGSCVLAEVILQSRNYIISAVIFSEFSKEM